MDRNDRNGRNDRNDQQHRGQYGDRDRQREARGGDDDRGSRERDDQQRWALDRDNFGGGRGPDRGGRGGYGGDSGDRQLRGRDDMQRRESSSQDDRDRGYGGGDSGSSGRDGDAFSRGWGRDDYGFRGPSFHQGSRNDAELDNRGDRNVGGWQAPGAQRRDHYQASGGYFEDRGAGHDPYRERQGGGGRSTVGGTSEYGRGRDGGMPGRGDGRYGSGPMPGEGGMRTSHRGKGPKNFTRSDERIHEDVCHLLEDCHVDASNIEVRVTNGEVTLEGTVTDCQDKREAEDAAAEARGVKQVHNLLRTGGNESTGTSASQSSNGSRGGTSRPSEAGRS